MTVTASLGRIALDDGTDVFVTSQLLAYFYTNLIDGDIMSIVLKFSSSPRNSIRWVRHITCKYQLTFVLLNERN